VVLSKQGFTAALHREKLRFVQSIALNGGPVAGPIEGTMTFRHGAKETIKDIESNTKVTIHEAFTVYAAVMNVVESPRFQKPCFEKRDACHPEIVDVHPVVQVAEHQDRPGKQGTKREHFVNMRYV